MFVAPIDEKSCKIFDGGMEGTPEHPKEPVKAVAVMREGNEGEGHASEEHKVAFCDGKYPKGRCGACGGCKNTSLCMVYGRR